LFEYILVEFYGDQFSADARQFGLRNIQDVVVRYLLLKKLPNI